MLLIAKSRNSYPGRRLSPDRDWLVSRYDLDDPSMVNADAADAEINTIAATPKRNKTRHDRMISFLNSG